MRTMHYPFLIAITSSLLLSSHVVSAADLQAQLDRFFHNRFPDERQTVVVEIKTPQAQWPQCDNPQLTLPSNTRVWGNVSVSVRCATQQRFVQVEVQVTGEYAVSTRQLSRGTKLTPQDIKQARGRLDLLPPRAILRSQEVKNAVLLRDMPPGQPLTSAMIRRVWVVKSGQQVQVIAGGDGFSINSEGKAMNNAAAGQSVRVRMLSGRIVNGVADDEGIVRISQ